MVVLTMPFAGGWLCAGGIPAGFVLYLIPLGVFFAASFEMPD